MSDNCYPQPTLIEVHEDGLSFNGMYQRYTATATDKYGNIHTATANSRESAISSALKKAIEASK